MVVLSIIDVQELWLQINLVYLCHDIVLLRDIIVANSMLPVNIIIIWDSCIMLHCKKNIVKINKKSWLN